MCSGGIRLDELSAGVIASTKGLLEIKTILEQGPNAELAVKGSHVSLAADRHDTFR